MRAGSVIRRISPPLSRTAASSARASAADAAARHLRLGGAREQRRDVMAEAAHAQIDLAQAVEEQQPGLHGRMLELLLHEFQRRQRAHFQQAAAGGAALKQARRSSGGSGGAPALGHQDVVHDRHELVLPAPQRLGVAPAELRERRDRALDVGPPFERAAIARQQRDVEFRLDVARAVPLELEVGVPRHRRDGALEEGVRVVQEARMARVFQRRKPAAGDRPALDRTASSARPCRDRPAG